MKAFAEARRDYDAPGAPPDRSTLMREIIALSWDDEGGRGRVEAVDASQIAPRSCASGLLYDAECDRKYAASDPRFEGVMHVFHQQFHGIRAAVGALPGGKVAVPVDCQVRATDRATLLTKAAAWGTAKAVFHGFSPALEPLLKTLCAEGIACYLVWHGNLAQLAWRPEVDFFQLARRAAERGLFRRAHMLKAGMSAIFPNAFAPMLLNAPPLVKGGRLAAPFAGQRATALVPARMDIRKNVHSSIIGCALSTIESIWHYAHIRGDLPVLARCKRIPYVDHDQHLSLLKQVDVTVNVSVVDCHPMVEMEALAAGAMSLTGPLHLDALGDHAYTKLSVIANPFDIGEVASRLDFLRGVDSAELAAIIADYVRAIRLTSLERYAEFLSL